jgi:hypothetical protein
MSQPHIAIIDGSANVIRALCETDADLIDEICRNASASTAWTLLHVRAASPCAMSR